MLSRVFAIVLAVVLWGPANAYAQAGASVAGTVTDESKAVLPGATVTATELSTGRQYVGVTDERGQYRLVNVAPGTYKIQAELAGFGTVVLPKVELLVGQNATIPFILKIATLEETVTVTGESPLVDTSSSQIAGNVDRRQMEELPLQGRNWMELSLLVKGITANDVNDNRPGEARDEHFQLNLDGQQITQRVASSFFGQPKFSREAIAEFQIVTNLFDITQGRSAGIQVQAITRSGTNNFSGSFYGYFRDDKFNAADHVARAVLPFQNQQAGGTVGGPIKRDKLHYFFSYEYERQPGTIFAQPPQLPSQSFTLQTKTIQNSLTARADHAISSKDHLSYRLTYWDFDTPVDMATSSHPSEARRRTQDSTNVLGTWSRVLNDRMVQEIKVGYNGFNWQNLLAFPQVGGSPQAFGKPADPNARFQPGYVFPGLTIGPPRNFPQLFIQDLFSARYDLTWNRDRHDLKIGAEFLAWKDGGEWHLLERGEFVFDRRPPDLERRFPASSALNPAGWDVSGLDSLVNRFQQNVGDWTIDIPRPTWAIWFGDTWHTTEKLTVNYGVRWDVDLGATAPPHVTTKIPFEPAGGVVPHGNAIALKAGEPLFKNGIRDLNNVAPRVGFAYNVTGKADFVIRGGSGLYYTVSSSNVTFSQQSFNTERILVNSYPNDGLPGFLQDPTRGVTPADVRAGKVPLPPQSPRVIAHDYVLPYTWQSSIGFQKQLGPALAVEADLAHWREYNSPRSLDPNVFFDPVTGYNKDIRTFGRPDPKFTSIRWIESKGKQDYLALSSAVTRRFKDNFQAGLTYTLMFYKHDNTTDWGYFPDNPFNPDADWARAFDFQRHTLRFNGIYRLPWDMSVAGAYFYGSSNYFNTTVAGTAPFGKEGNNRLNIGIPIQISSSVAGRFNGPAVIGTGEVVPRDALKGKPLHKVDLRVTKEFRLGGDVRLAGIAEVFNLFNHANFGAYNGQVNSARFGNPLQNPGTAYVPRSGQFAFRLAF